MAQELLMPKLGLTMEEGTVEQWMKKVGDTIEIGEIVYSVATDKLTNDIESDKAGILLKIVVEEGETVPCKTVVAYVGEAGEVVGDVVATASAETAPVAATAAPVAQAAQAPVRAVGEYVTATPYAKKLAKERGIDLGAVAATGYNGVVVAKDVENYVPTSAEASIKASPLAKKVAADLGIDLADIGAEGRVLAQDILAYLKEGAVAVEAAPVQAEEVVRMDGMRKAIAKNMLNSVQTSPTVTFNLSVDMTAMKSYRQQLKSQDIKVSFTDLIIKFVSKALTEFPLLNSSIDGNNIIKKHYVNMGVAVALDNGLMVPNIKNSDKKSLTEISAEVKELADACRNGTLPMEKLKGGTFTITNLGMYGIESFSPIINQPEVAILGVNTMEDKVVVRNGEMVIRPMMNFSLTADHRIIDGSVAAEFMQRVKTLMENPALMLA